MIQHTVKYSDTCLLFICSQHTVKYTDTDILFIWSNIVSNTLLHAFSLYGPTHCQILGYVPSLYMFPVHCQIHWYWPSLCMVQHSVKYAATGPLFIWSNTLSNALLQAFSLYGPTHCHSATRFLFIWSNTLPNALLQVFSLYGPKNCQISRYTLPGFYGLVIMQYE